MPRAARVTDDHTCPLVDPATNTPHVGGPILRPGAPTVLINGMPAARVGDHASCKGGVPPDTIRGGSLSVFIEGSPAARMGDPTDQGSVVMGSSNVIIGDWPGGPLIPFQARWLYDYLADQKDIPFEFANDGCFARADRMADHIAALGIDVKKQFVYATQASGPLHVPIANYPRGGVTWGYHVAPVVKVDDGSGPTPTVMDPSLGSGPLTIDQWIGCQTSNPGDVITATTDTNVYYRPPAGSPVLNSDPNITSTDLETYRQERAGLPASSGRNIPNAPVHF